MIEQIAHEVRSNPKLPVTTQLRAVALNRQRYYRYLHQEPTPDREMALRSEIQRIALEWPCYGTRRVAKALAEHGYRVNRKRVQRFMREDNLLCLRSHVWFSTTNSRHGYAVYPNLVPDLRITGPNQLWVSDITYIRLESEFIYLSVVMDAFSRRVIGWELSRDLDSGLALAALRMALSSRDYSVGLVHHSDQGVQYASTDYTEMLHRCGIRISMSRKGNPYDNAKAERFMKTLKYEEVYLNDYRDDSEARKRIASFLEEVYNRKRLHSALDYRSPAAFEASLPPIQSADSE